MIQRIKLHALCIAHKPHTLGFHAAGIMREIELAYYLCAPIVFKVWVGTH